MPQKVIKFKGINRRINEFQCSGECEELINVRSMPTGLEVVKPKHTVRNGTQCEMVYEHSFGNTSNLIVNKNEGVFWLTEDGSETPITLEFAGKRVSISSSMNVLVIYCKEDSRQLVFKFNEGKYESYEIVVKPIINASIEYSEISAYTAQAATDSVGAFNEALTTAASAYHNKFPNGLCGAAIVGCTYELEDGSEMWSTAFVVANTAKRNGYIIPVTLNKSEKKVSVSGAENVSLRLSFGSVTPINVTKVNVYATRPVFPYKVDSSDGSYVVKELKLDELNLGGQLMYYQGSISLKESIATMPLKFSAEQVGERVMEVDAGCIERIGDVVSFNNRFHYYNSKVNHTVQIATVSDTISNTQYEAYWIAYIKFNGKWRLINKKYVFSTNSMHDFIYPMAGIRQIVFVKAELSERGEFLVPYEEMAIVDLKDSAAYNYSYAFDHTPNVVQIDERLYDEWSESGQIWGNQLESKVLLREEPNAVNVSAQYNPFVFPVKYSYAFGGEILDIATSYLPISSTQIGQYPLSVFTSNGIYALEQGSGDTLYGNIIPLQPHVIDGKAVATPYGTFFISSKGLYILVGREATKVSDALEGTREIAIRDNEAYSRLYCNNRSPLYDFSRLLSSKDFEEFTDGAILTYDQLQNELYICSPSTTYYYSYVFNLNTKAFHKVSRKYIATNGCRYAVEVIGGERNIVDLHTERKIDNQTILLQSRPMTIETFFTHLQRLILLSDAKLTRNQNLCLTVFGSDNLDNWKCIISSQKTDATFRQIRTNKAAKSYRDYIIVISGTLDTSTDISDLIADYTVVTRRLG